MVLVTRVGDKLWQWLGVFGLEEVEHNEKSVLLFWKPQSWVRGFAECYVATLYFAVLSWELNESSSISVSWWKLKFWVISYLKALGSVSLYGTVVVRPLKHESYQVGEIMTFSELESGPEQGETSIAELRVVT